MSNISRSCLIKVTNDALIIANDGQPFSRRGIISICASHLGTKYDDSSKQLDVVEIDGDLFNFIDKVQDVDLIEAIQDRQIQTYKINPDLIPEHERGEREIGLDYSGRFIWELLQNADDAMAPLDMPTSQLIGAKGLGFKSVMEVTTEPEIHSGPFHLHFSLDKTLVLLKKHGFSGIKQPPVFRIPFKKEPDEGIKELLECYATVLRLPFANHKREQVCQSLRELDAHVLLFCQHIEELRIILDENLKRIWTAKRETDRPLTDCRIRIMFENEPEADFSSTEYQRWAKTWNVKGQSKLHSVSICLPLDENRKPIPMKYQQPLHVFFPTEEELPFRSIIHSSFDLSQNRKLIRKSDSDALILKELSLILKRMISEGVPVSTILKAFAPASCHLPDKESWAERIWLAFKDILMSENFLPVIGGHAASPLKSHTWEFNIGNILSPTADEVKMANLVIPEIQDDAHCLDALKNLGTTPLPLLVYQKLILNCLNNTPDECEKIVQSLYRIIVTSGKQLWGERLEACLDHYRKAECWWNHEGRARPLEGNLTLYKEPPRQMIPEWLPIDYLNDDFYSSLESILQNPNSQNETWNDFLKDYLHESGHGDVLYYSLVPELENHTDQTWWENHGPDVLEFYRKLDLEVEETDTLIWEDENRIRLGYALRLPTDKGWMPAICCYAGLAWGGPEEFDAFFQNTSDRGVLSPPDSWPLQIEESEFELFSRDLQYAGVSWQMKLIRWREKEKRWPIRRNPASGQWISESPFGKAVNKVQWDEYWISLEPHPYDDRTEFDWNTTVHEQWAIEYFPDALPKKAIDRLKVLKSISIPISDSCLEYKYSMQGGHFHNGHIVQKQGRLQSFASWQLHNYPWMPCRSNLFYKGTAVPPGEAYIPEREFTGFLPEIDISLPHGQEGRDLQTYMTRVLRVKEKLPPSSGKEWKYWAETLPEKAQTEPDMEKIKTAARGIYKSLFKLNEKPAGLSAGMKIPCIWRGRDNQLRCEQETLGFQLSGDMYWLDKPYFAEPITRKSVLEHYRIFLLELDEGRKAEEWLGIEPLSSIITIEPLCGHKDDRMTEIVRSRYKERYKILGAIDENIELPEPDELNLSVVEYIRLPVLAEGIVIASPSVYSWREDETIMIDSRDPWRGLGLALDTPNDRRRSDTFENLLKAEEWSEVLERTRERGISDAVLRDIIVTSADLQVDEAATGDKGSF